MQWALRHACNFSEGPWKPRIQLHSSASWECRLLVLESSKLYLAVEAKGLPYTYIFKAAVHSLSDLGRAGVLTAAHSSLSALPFRNTPEEQVPACNGSNIAWRL